LGGVGYDFSRDVHTGAAAGQLRIEENMPGRKDRRVAISELGKPKADAAREHIAQARVDFNKKIFSAIIARAVVGVGVPVIEPILLVAAPDAACKHVSIQSISI